MATPLQDEPLPGHPRRDWVPPRRVSEPGLTGWRLLASVGAAGVVLGAVLLLPRYLVVWDVAGAPKPGDRARAVNDVRATLLQGLGGAALAVGAYFTWKQLQIGRDGQITDRFTAAVGQLGESSDDVRVGGIFALERIARDSRADRGAIHDVLCAYVRHHALLADPDPWPDGEAAQDMEPAAKRELARVADQLPPLRVRALDVQAAVTVLGRRLPSHGAPLDLDRVDLRRCDLYHADLSGADLHYADLSACNMTLAVLEEADMTRTRLAAAVLSSANLRGADLRDVALWHARLDGTDLRATDLSGADFTGARLEGAALAQADLRGADLSSVDLGGATLTDAVADSTTRWPPGFDHRAAGVIVTDDGPALRPRTIDV